MDLRRKLEEGMAAGIEPSIGEHSLHGVFNWDRLGKWKTIGARLQ